MDATVNGSKLLGCHKYCHSAKIKISKRLPLFATPTKKVDCYRISARKIGSALTLFVWSPVRPSDEDVVVLASCLENKFMSA